MIYFNKFNKIEIESRLDLIKEVIEKLSNCRESSKEEFLRDFKISDSAIRNLILGVEIVTDIGNYLLAEVFQINPKEYSEVIIQLGNTGIIDKKFAEENSNMAKFRNLLVHEYIKVDLDKVYDYLQKAPDIFRKFAKHFVNFLEKE